MRAVINTWYDGEHQRDALVSVKSEEKFLAKLERSTPDTRALVLGQLRWDVLYGEKLFLTYAQLLDGAAFNILRPQDLLEELAVPSISDSGGLPIRVNAHDADLRESLKAMVTEGYFFSSLPLSAAQRVAIQRQLAHVATPKAVARVTESMGVLEGINFLLSQCGALDASVRSRAVVRWQAWFDAAQAGDLHLEPSNKPADYAEAYRQEPPPSSEEMLTEEGRRGLAAWVNGEIDDVQGRPQRSKLIALLEPMTSSGDADQERDAQYIRQAFVRTSYRAVAAAEECALAFAADRSYQAMSAREARREQARNPRIVIFPEQFELRLGLMSTGAWQSFANDSSDDLSHWWESHEPDALQNIGNRLAMETRRQSLRGTGSKPVTTVHRIVRSTARNVGIALGGATAEAADKVTNNPLGAASAAIAASVTVAAIVALQDFNRDLLSSYRGIREVIELPE